MSADMKLFDLSVMSNKAEDFIEFLCNSGFEFHLRFSEGNVEHYDVKCLPSDVVTIKSLFPIKICGMRAIITPFFRNENRPIPNNNIQGAKPSQSRGWSPRNNKSNAGNNIKGNVRVSIPDRTTGSQTIASGSQTPVQDSGISSPASPAGNSKQFFKPGAIPYGQVKQQFNQAAKSNLKQDKAVSSKTVSSESSMSSGSVPVVNVTTKQQKKDNVAAKLLNSSSTTSSAKGKGVDISRTFSGMAAEEVRVKEFCTDLDSALVNQYLSFLSIYLYPAGQLEFLVSKIPANHKMTCTNYVTDMAVVFKRYIKQDCNLALIRNSNNVRLNNIAAFSVSKYLIHHNINYSQVDFERATKKTTMLTSDFMLGVKAKLSAMFTKPVAQPTIVTTVPTGSSDPVDLNAAVPVNPENGPPSSFSAYADDLNAVVPTNPEKWADVKSDEDVPTVFPPPLDWVKAMEQDNLIKPESSVSSVDDGVNVITPTSSELTLSNSHQTPTEEIRKISNASTIVDGEVLVIPSDDEEIMVGNPPEV